jgi:hypothetical protein
MSTKLGVEIEKIDTWPSDLLKLATQNKNIIISYQLESKRIDYRCRQDVVVRSRPPVNEYKIGYDNLVRTAHEILNKHNIIGYHCTRLTLSEINTIHLEGMKVLSSELIRSRLTFAHTQGYLSQAEFEYLTNLCNLHGTRTDKLWFCPNRSTLKDCSAVYRLFRSWGGEAMYCGHENDDRISATLRSIGIPCIVKCSLPILDVDRYPPDYAARFLSFFISGEVEYPEPPVGFDMCIERDLKASEVLDIIDMHNSAFEALTDYRNWNKQCKIHQQ